MSNNDNEGSQNLEQLEEDDAFDTWLLSTHETYKALQDLLKRSEDQLDEVVRVKVENTLSQMKKELDEHKSTNPVLAFQKTVLSALLKYELGKILESTSIDDAEKYYTEAWELVEEDFLHADCIFLSGCILGKLIQLLSDQGRDDEIGFYSEEHERVTDEFSSTFQNLEEFAASNYTGALADLFLRKRPDSFSKS